MGWPKGKPRSKAVRDRISKGLKIAYETGKRTVSDTTRTTLAQKGKDRLASPEAREEVSQRTKAALASPEVRAKISAGVKAAMATSVARCIDCGVARNRWSPLEEFAPGAYRCRELENCGRRQRGEPRPGHRSGSP